MRVPFCDFGGSCWGNRKREATGLAVVDCGECEHITRVHPTTGAGTSMAPDLSAKRFVERLEAHQSDVELAKIKRYFKSGAGDYGEGDEFLGVCMGQVFDLAKEFVDMEPAEIEKLLDHPLHEVRAGALSIMDKQARRRKTPQSRRKELFNLYLRRIDRINNWDLIRKAVGGWLRAAGDKAPQRLLEFFDAHAADMPRTMLRYAIEHLEKEQREYYLNLKREV